MDGDDEDHTVQIPVRAVGKRFVSNHRVVVCWEGTAKWPREIVAQDGSQNVPMHEKGWGVIRQVPGSPGLSAVQMCILTKPGVSDERMLAADRPDKLKSFVEVIIPSYQQVLHHRYQMLENTLFDESL